MPYPTDDEDRVDPALYSLEGGPSKPKPLYNDGLVQTIAQLVEAGARLLEAEGTPLARSRDVTMLWSLVAEGKRLIDREIKRRTDKNKAAQKGSR